MSYRCKTIWEVNIECTCLDHFHIYGKKWATNAVEPYGIKPSSGAIVSIKLIVFLWNDESTSHLWFRIDTTDTIWWPVKFRDVGQLKISRGTEGLNPEQNVVLLNIYYRRI